MIREEICLAPATEIAARVASRDVSPVEVVAALLAAIEERNPAVNAFITVLGDEALAQAREAEQAVMARAPLGLLHGVPVAIKDLFDFKQGVRNTFGSAPFTDFVAPTTSAYIDRLERAGAIVLGKTNVPEFGHKGTTDNLIFGPCSTPFAVGKNAGGSSGGSAAAVGAGLVPLAQGTDGGGSVRIPAALSGVYGLKPSFGRIADQARPNAFVNSTPFVHVGSLTRTVGDAALMLDAMAGPDPRDPYSLPAVSKAFSTAVGSSIADFRIAYITEMGDFPVEPAVTEVVREAVAAFEHMGAAVDTVTLPFAYSQQELCDVWMREIGVLYADSMRNFTQFGFPVDFFDQHRDEFTPDFVHLVELGRTLTALDYKRDDAIRTTVFDPIADLFDRFDLLILPTLAVASINNAADGLTVGPTQVNGVEVDPRLGWCLTYPINYTGNPAASIPAGLTTDGFPVGMQIVGRRFADDDVLAASAAFETARPWHHWYRTLLAERGESSDAGPVGAR
jgi:amidase/aspartyl-tRNA(Asn)/glutamyl-tRNA(Gln) amidotransferase subunit A